MRTTFFGWIAFILAISACSKTDLPQVSSKIKEEPSELQSSSLRSPNSQTLSVEELRQFLLQKYSQQIKPQSNNTYLEYGKIGCGYNFFTDKSEEFMNIELECQDNIKSPILNISSETIKKIDVNPLNLLEVKIHMYKEFKKDFSDFFYSIANSNELKASVDFKLKWLAKASASYEKKNERRDKKQE